MHPHVILSSPLLFYLSQVRNSFLAQGFKTLTYVLSLQSNNILDTNTQAVLLHLFQRDVSERSENVASPCIGNQISVLVHVTENLLHWSVSYGTLEENLFDASCGNVPKQWQHQEQPTETCGLSRVLSPSVLTQHHLCLIL
jgi:hypothetical protein